MQQLIYRAWLKRESLPRDNRSHAPDEVRSKCLDLSRICIAEVEILDAPRTVSGEDVLPGFVLDLTDIF
jgi:hypothetical protein